MLLALASGMSCPWNRTVVAPQLMFWRYTEPIMFQPGWSEITNGWVWSASRPLGLSTTDSVGLVQYDWPAVIPGKLESVLRATYLPSVGSHLIRFSTVIGSGVPSGRVGLKVSAGSGVVGMSGDAIISIWPAATGICTPLTRNGNSDDIGSKTPDTPAQLSFTLNSPV